MKHYVGALQSFSRALVKGEVPYGPSLAYWRMQGEKFCLAADDVGLPYACPDPLVKFWPKGGLPTMVTHFLANVKTLPGLPVRPEAVSFAIPQGSPGSQGLQGPQGAQVPQGTQGSQGSPVPQQSDMMKANMELLSSCAVHCHRLPRFEQTLHFWQHSFMDRHPLVVQTAWPEKVNWDPPLRDEDKVPGVSGATGVSGESDQVTPDSMVFYAPNHMKYFVYWKKDMRCNCGA